MIKFLKSLYFTQLFFASLLIFSTCFIFAFFFEFLYSIFLFLGFIFCVLIFIELILLYSSKNPIKILRNYPEKFSNSDKNELCISLISNFSYNLKCRIIEELPVQFQKRDFEIKLKLINHQKKDLYYSVIPKKRGEYIFNFCNVFISLFGLIERRIILRETKIIPCYPSFIQVKKYSLMAISNRLHELGIKKIRKIGSTLEFERIQEYTKGDNYKYINWKASGKLNKLMVNRYEDEKSQPIISIIDTGRSMRMPFEDLTLLDYSINSTLLLSNVSILKKDKAGLITFSKNIEKFIPSDKKNHQIKLISEALYNVSTDFKESEFSNLYATISQKINQRSLLFLYTNFETIDALRRQLKYLRLLNRKNLLIIILFKNTELQDLANKKTKKIHEIYDTIIAEKFIYEKQLIVKELQIHGIQTILTEPKNLTINTLNKYLEIKARGMI